MPYFNGQGYSGNVVRIDLEAFNTKHDDPTTQRTQRNAAITTLKLTDANERARGYCRGFAKGGYAYFAPLFDGEKPGTLLTRVHVTDFDQARDS